MTPVLGLEVLSEVIFLGERDQKVAGIVRVSAPPEPKPQPMRYVMAVDRSSSMRGAPLADALRTTQAFAKALSDEDELAVLTFDASAQLVASPASVASLRHSLGGTLEQVAAGLGTNIEDALKTACVAATDNCKRPAHIFLLTDGEPTVGELSTAGVRELLRNAKNVATLQVFGLSNHVNPSMLRALAEIGSGSYMFIPEGGATAEAIGASLGRVLSTEVIDCQITLRPHRDVSIADVWAPGRVALIDEGRGRRVQIGAVVGGEPVDVAFALEWSGPAPSHPLVLAEARARHISAGDLGARQQLEMTVEPTRGATVPEVAASILVSQLGDAMRDASEGLTPYQAVRVLRQAIDRVSGAAWIANVTHDPLFRTAVKLAREAVEQLETGSVPSRQAFQQMQNRGDSIVARVSYSVHDFALAPVTRQSQFVGMAKVKG